MAKQNKGRKLFATTASAALVASAIVPVASAAQLNDFNTVPSWAKDAVQYLADNNILQGDEKGNFNPNGTLTRAQAAEVLYKALGLEATGTEDFKDVTNTNWYYKAVLATSPELFEGFGDGNFKPNQKLTRAQAAKVLVIAYDLKGEADVSNFTDAAKVPAWAADYFSTAVANGVINGKGSRLAPSDDISRAEFATMVKRAIDADTVNADVASVKAINATTVEVDFKENIEDIDALDFAIEGLEVKNAVVKQTDASVAVLTTSTQEGGKEYTVTNDGKTLGKFKGVSAVLPTAVSFVNKSVQGIYGQEVTVSAQVTVAEGQSKAGIPVTFNIDSNADNATGSFGKDFVAEAYTNDQGVATYSYTQYNSKRTEDTVTAYATGKANARGTAQVYWADVARLAVKDVTEGSTIANSNTKVYQVTSKENAGEYVAVTFKENLNVAPDKVVKGVKFTDANVYSVSSTGALTQISNGVPFEVTTGGHQVALVKLNSDGVGNFTLTGADATVTPIVYDHEDSKLNVSALTSTKEELEYDATDLQATASTVTFSVNQNVEIGISSKGVQKAAARNANNGTGIGGREYTVTLKDKNGKVAGEGTTAYIYFDKASTGNSNSSNHNVTLTKVVDGKETTTHNVVRADSNNISDAIPVTVDKNGQATFVIRGAVNDYATPIAVYNNGNDTAKIDSSDAKATGEIVYFGDATVGASKLKITSVETGKEVTSITGNDVAKVEYIAVDQNGFPYYNSTTDDFISTLSFTEAFANYTVSATAGGAELPVISGENNRKTYRVTATNGKVTVYVSSSKGTVDFTATTTDNVLEAKSGSITFNTLADNATLTGAVHAVNTTDNKVTLLVKGQLVELSYKDADLFYKGSSIGVDEAYFEGKLKVGAQVAYNKATDSSKAKFNILEDAASLADYANRVNYANSATEVEGILATAGLTPTFDNLTTTQKRAVATDVFNGIGAGYTEISLRNAYQTSYADEVAAAIDAVEAAALAAVPTKLAEVPGLDLSEYDALTDSTEIAAVNTAIEAGTYADLQALQNGLTAAIRAAKASSTFAELNETTAATSNEDVLAALEGISGVNLTALKATSPRVQGKVLESIAAEADKAYAAPSEVNAAIRGYLETAAITDDISVGIESITYASVDDTDTLTFVFSDELDLPATLATADVTALGITFADGNTLGTGATATYDAATDTLEITLGADHDIVAGTSVVTDIQVNDIYGVALNLSAVKPSDDSNITDPDDLEVQSSL
ncbi:S-layer homology domain-containing protein [Lysinibacillus yapensis]|uniref:S-layer homology domain-containing protein n=1 Tax=Ureibacillus yapensis TaxID=2304605 RepID=A0A396SI39_9BACL|nr:S-layer homology domain-containing protein [Lysinibacillus yapensis]RHW39968.1 S-layer homology domain-containing protein [Lysinibacillus yapensis]